jgi:mono/diheme cytochrome c family protein
VRRARMQFRSPPSRGAKHDLCAAERMLKVRRLDTLWYLEPHRNFDKAHRMKTRILPMIGLILLAAATMAAADDIDEGRQIYLQHCASCHGLTAEGNGPLAPVLTTPPTNLRLLSERFGNPLPEDQIARFIDGRADVRAHGPRDMPVWGERFYAEDGSRGMVKERIAKLVAYLQSIQSRTHHASLKIKPGTNRAERAPL